jgi:phage shock protein C
VNATTSPPPASPNASLSSARDWFEANGLSRSKEHRVLGGVSAALARRYGVDRLVMRLAMIAGVIVLSPLVYVALWILMPSES